jgi:hypothetical protein
VQDVRRATSDQDLVEECSRLEGLDELSRLRRFASRSCRTSWSVGRQDPCEDVDSECSVYRSSLLFKSACGAGTSR